MTVKLHFPCGGKERVSAEDNHLFAFAFRECEQSLAQIEFLRNKQFRTEPPNGAE